MNFKRFWEVVLKGTFRAFQKWMHLFSMTIETFKKAKNFVTEWALVDRILVFLAMEVEKQYIWESLRRLAFLANVI